MARPKAFNEEEALDKAMHLFWEKGFEATSIQDLVENLGVNRQSLYDTFGDKKQLFLKSLQAYRTKGLQNLLLLEGNKPVQEKFQALFHAIIDASLNDPCNRGCFMGNATLELAASDKEVTKIICTNIEGYEKAFKETLVEAQRKGEINSKEDPEALGSYLFNSIQGLRITAKATRDRARLEHIAAITLSVLS